MFGNARNAISAYQKVGVDAAVEVADPYRLILLALCRGPGGDRQGARRHAAKTGRCQGRGHFESHRHHRQRPQGQPGCGKRRRARRTARRALRLPGPAPAAGQSRQRSARRSKKFRACLKRSMAPGGKFHPTARKKPWHECVAGTPGATAEAFRGDAGRCRKWRLGLARAASRPNVARSPTACRPT
jgi:hypothetical protein